MQEKAGFPKTERKADTFGMLQVWLGFMNFACLPSLWLCCVSGHRNRLEGALCHSGL